MKHEFDGLCMPGKIYSGFKTFSVGIYPVVPTKSGEGTKKCGKVKVRVSGPTKTSQLVYDRAKEIIAELDAGTYNGPKNVKVK